MSVTEALGDLIVPKSCFYLLKLRTGCYMIGGLYLFVGVMMFYEEFTRAVDIYRDIEINQHLNVMFIYDLNPTVYTIFSSCLFYGLYNETRLLIFPLYVVLINTLLEIIVEGITYFIYYRYMHHFYYLLISGAINGYTATIIYAHYKELAPAKNKKEVSANITEFENQNCA